MEIPASLITIPSTKVTMMKTVTDTQELNQLIENDAVFILFGGKSCAVCNSLKPKLETIILQRLPKMQLAYVDCELSPDICAQHSVFTLPVVKTYIEGMLIAEDSRAFGIEPLIQKIERSYSMWCEQS